MSTGSEETELELRVEGMSCQHCVAAVTGAVEPVSGVIDVAVDLDRGLVTVHGRAGMMDREQVAGAIRTAGYVVAGETGGAPS